MDGLYPPGPASAPADLTKPTRRFRTHAWLAVLVLLGFVALYFLMTGWFGWTAYRLVRDGAGSGHTFVGALKALPAAFVFAFLFRGLFAVKHAHNPAAIEVRPEDEPQLFEFLNRIADEAGAPRAHRVFLSPDVNAGVFYDLSLLNLILPSKKNLELGLGLVNCLTLGELKAVLAHEFGHFAQRTMAVGRWVYIAEQVAGHIVVTRGAFDRILQFISSIDLRIAWIGWIMRLVVWSIRAVLDTGFRLVVLSRQALSREMELQADLVAVSLTGSDALVHALHKLHAADDAYGRAFGFAQGELQKGRTPEDLFAVQSRMMESVRRITGDETYGVAPPVPESGRQVHRVFPDRFAQPPRMWASHPPNRDREENAKRAYVEAPSDERPAWLLFREPEATRRQMTRHLFGLIRPDGLPEETQTAEGSVDEVDASFGRTYLHTRYRGLYLGRGVTRSAATPDELCDDLGTRTPPDDVLTRWLEGLYPEELRAELDAYFDLEEEHATLQALRDGFLTAPGGVVRYRGREIRRRDLGRVIDEVARERDGAHATILARDRACRTTHRLAARAIGGGWEEYHAQLVALLHYAEHTEADLRDADGHLQNVFAVVIADGRVSSSERQRLVLAADEAQQALARAFGQKNDVYLPDAVAKRMEIGSWAERLGDLGLGTPTADNIGDWLQIADSWLLTVAADFGSLRAVTLEVLLDAEEHIARCARGECEAGEAPEPARVPASYVTLLPGRERERQKKLDLWDRFQVAEGFFPGVARFAVAGAVLGAAFLVGGFAVEHSILVHNGLGAAVHVSIGGEESFVGPGLSAEIDLPDGDTVHIRTTTRSGELVEELDADVSNTQAQYVYNVAGAAPLAEWTAVYGPGSEPPPRMLGAPRVTRTSADVLFSEPPTSVSTRSGYATLRVLASLADSDPIEQLGALDSEEEERNLILTHARFDPAGSPHLRTWLRLAAPMPEGGDILARRLRETPDDVVLLRLEQDVAGDGRAAVCARQRERLARSPGPDAEYLGARCLPDPAARAQAFLDGYGRYPDHPFFARAAGSVLGAGGRWEEGLEALERAVRSRPDLAGELVIEMARLRRAAAPDPRAADLDDLRAQSPMLQRMLDFEQGAEWTLTGPARAYVAIAAGNLEQALSIASGADEETGAAIVRLAAASDGAPDDLRARARALAPDQGMGISTVWSAIALAVRGGDDPAPLVEEARELVPPDYVDVMLRWASADALGEDAAAVEATLRELDPALRGHARVMGVIALGPDAPPEWRREARALLFPTERPYLAGP